MRQVAARVKHPCFGVRVASVHKINRLHLENVACRGEKLLFEKTVFKTFCGEKDDKYMKTPHFRAVFSVLHLHQHILVCPTGFEPAAFRVGVIRPSNRKPLRRRGLIGLAQISTILQKNLGSLAGQDFRDFSR